MRPSRWTPEMDERLTELARMRLTTYQAAKQMGLKREQVKKRSVRIGVRFGRYTRLQQEVGTEGHIPADERSAELLRAAGVRI